MRNKINAKASGAPNSIGTRFGRDSSSNQQVLDNGHGTSINIYVIDDDDKVSGRETEDLVKKDVSD